MMYSGNLFTVRGISVEPNEEGRDKEGGFGLDPFIAMH